MTEIVKPLYTIYQYGDSGIYKVIKFKRHDSMKMRMDVDDDVEQKCNDSKLANNLARSKNKVLQLALCNPWEYFCTFTLDKEKYNRYDLKKFQKDLSQWFRDLRKKYGYDIKFLYIPENHEDGAWHAHGLLYNVPSDMLCPFIPGVHPYKLIKKGYLNIPEYEKKFGFISVGKIKNKIACSFYITKYITKALTANALDLGVHTYRASKGLEWAVLACDVYYPVHELDAAIRYEGEFCSVGIVQKKDFTYGLDYAEFDDFDDMEIDNLYDDKEEELPDQARQFKHVPYEEVYDNGLFDLLCSMPFYNIRTGECVGVAGGV